MLSAFAERPTSVEAVTCEGRVVVLVCYINVSIFLLAFWREINASPSSIFEAGGKIGEMHFENAQIEAFLKVEAS